ncbi:PucR family transcriptional regulator [Kribbella deserti]|uniref:PucR family transcriptional regulator n=1 Tax=Kribbella deserti TaxID=1926257 RepID=A0ABV6QHL2_9ACTN
MTDVDPVRHASRTARGAAELDLGEVAIGLLRSRLPKVAESTVRAVIVEVPGYANALAGSMGGNIQGAVQLALGGFLNLASSPRNGGDPGTPLAPALEGAYMLGRGEARSGRSMDALLAAYRVGARVSWRELSSIAVEAGLSAETLAKFAELVFAYIDELSAASVAGHTDELATTGRVRQRYLQRLGRSLLLGEPADQLASQAGRADWEPPRTLTAVMLPNAQVRAVLALLDPRTLRPEDEVPELEEEVGAEVAVLLVPDADGPARLALLRSLRGRQAWVGPSQPWTMVRTSYLRVLRARRLGLVSESDAPVDTDRQLAALVVAADPAALEDLRRRVLAPFEALRPATAERLVQTLREWLLHLGRRDDVAAAMHVHPQTVRYRMGQIRELFGERLEDPQVVVELTIALATYSPAKAESTDKPPS